ncbi:beta-N-acetylhexosaminidase [Streptomyces sp. NPDC006367]|uniref:beta-N-acetylhexosaminidase n=1 Tax=unclassified Streptomyces TaxID=2593676 RepID=UPI0033B38028
MIVPRPRLIRTAEGTFVLDASTTLASDPQLDGAARWLRGALGPATGCHLPTARTGEAGIALVLDGGLGAEDYRLTVTPTTVTVEAGGPAGAFYGAQTLRQLLPAPAFRAGGVTRGPWRIPAVTVEDGPRFRWRGTMLDVARHFVPKAELLRFVDLLALHKLNVLHLHLTDDHGWRLEIKRHPRLTERGAWRSRTMIGRGPHHTYDDRPHGGYYTQDDIREIVAYAADRHITVVPEIDIPGHTQAAIAAYPSLGVTGTPVEVATDWGPSPHVLNAEESTLRFFEEVFDEVLGLFPSRYVCVGGDECVKTQWRADPRTQERIRELGLADEHELQAWFINRFDRYLGERGRKLFGWDEILQGGLAEGATVAAWRGSSAAHRATALGHEVVTCPLDRVYLDYRQSSRPDEPVPVGCVVTLEDVYGFDPVPEGLTDDRARLVIGAQAAVWTEHMDSSRVRDYLVFPRLVAFAETVWASPERDFEDFGARLRGHLERLDALGVEYRPADGPHPWQQRPDVKGWPRERDDIMTDVFRDSA